MSTWPRTSSRPSPAKFDPRKFKDEYEKALKKLVRRKAKGHVIEEAPSPERTDNVISGRDRGNLERTPRQELCEPRIFFEMLAGTPEDRMRTPRPGCDVVK
jgi:hypothetical protein